MEISNLFLLTLTLLDDFADSSPEGISVRDGNEPQEKAVGKVGTRVECRRGRGRYYEPSQILLELHQSARGPHEEVVQHVTLKENDSDLSIAVFNLRLGKTHEEN